MDVVVEHLNNLRLDCLDDAWVQAIYHAEFLEFGDLPPEYENIADTLELRSIFRDIMKSVDSWLSLEPSSSEEKSWSTLSQQVQHERVLAILAYFIDYGCKNVVTKEHRNNALLASRVYYKLLSVSGYKAYHIYHSQLFAHSLACLSFPKSMCDNEDSYYNTKELTREVNSVIKELRHFVLDLRAIIEQLQLNPSDMNFEDILSNLVDITGGAIVNKLNVDKIELANISRVIYEMIDILVCEANNEPNTVAIRFLFKCLLPKLVASSMDSRNANNLVRASYVTYSGLLLSKYGKAALSGYMVLLQHLCYLLDGLERAEVRTARVSLVVGLMSLLPRKSYRKIVKWLLQLTTTSKVLHRQIAMEMLAKLLNNDPEEVKEHDKPTENVPETKNISLEEGAEPANNQKEGDQQNLDDSGINESDTTTETNENETLPKDTMATDDESSQELPTAKEDHEMTEEDIAGLLRQRPHTAPHGEILRCVYERVHDVSSTLRTRALNILTECLASQREPMIKAVKELNGGGSIPRLMAIGARSVCDERAAVRRAGCALVQRLLLDNSAPDPQPTDLAILVSMCRDASILVRSGAIAALGEMLPRRNQDAVFDAFLTGPMHQLSDPENKVQDQVVAIVQQALVDRLRPFTEHGNEDPVPWQFLAAVTRHNMRRHLQKACNMLVKSSKCINHRLVDVLSTHMGALDDKRDLLCLVMLTSVARHVSYSEVGFILEYYYKLAENDQNRDVRLMPLTLELCSAWSRWTRTHERTALRDHLVRRLATANDDGCRIACAALAAQLDPDNLQWATELMQLSERRALESSDMLEALRCADLSLVAPSPPAPGILRLFLNIISSPPPDIQESRLGACVAGAGRLCIRSRTAATAAAPVFAKLLPDDTAPHAPRVNALLALTDICIRYTCIVEPLLDRVCGCLASRAPAALRRAAARSLTRLLLGGYLRLRTPLYYRYCALLADEEHEVREPAEYYVTCCLPTDAIFHHFVDCVLHYNNEDTETILFDARQLIYDVMLQRMSLVQKLNIQCRLAREVLEHAADVTDEGDGELPAGLNAALLDTITLLCGPRMKLPRKPQTSGDTADIDDLQERVTTNIVSHKMKRTVAEVLVPAVLRLYSRLRPRGGQVAAYLVRIATDLLNDYRHEIEELIENDEELVDRVQQFQETIGLEPTFGNARNLVTSSAPPEPETPRANKRRPRHTHSHSPRKRALRI